MSRNRKIILLLITIDNNCYRNSSQRESNTFPGPHDQ